VVRTDLVRLVPFQVQIAIRDETSPEEAELVSDILYEGGTLLTDTITDWMVASFSAKSRGPAGELLGIGNNTGFDSIALELVADSTSQGQVDGRVLNLVQVSFEGVSLWERRGTGTAPMEQEIVELIERATFLEDRKLRDDLQTTVSNLLFDLGIINDGDLVNAEGEQSQSQSITIVDVRAYITPPGSGFQNNNNNNNNNINNNFNNNNNNNDNGGIATGAPTSNIGTGTGTGSNNNNNNNNQADKANRNLEIIIIVAIVVACLAFALLIFAVCWAWRADRHERKPSGRSRNAASSSQASSNQRRRSSGAGLGGGNKRSYRAQINNGGHTGNDRDNGNDDNDNDTNDDDTRENPETAAAAAAAPKRRGSNRGRFRDQSGSSGRRLFSRGKSKSTTEKQAPPPLSQASSNGSYPRVIGDTSRGMDTDTDNDNDNDNDNSTNPRSKMDDSVVSSDISSSLTAYYKNAFHQSNRTGSGGVGGTKDHFNDAASMSSMDSYGYSLDGYAPSLGPTQGGYPVGPLHAARDAPIPLGDSQDEQNVGGMNMNMNMNNYNNNNNNSSMNNNNTMHTDVDVDAMQNIRQMQDEESVVDYEAEA